ncbi:hypothetical protein [Azospirillum endophyticum]
MTCWPSIWRRATRALLVVRLIPPALLAEYRAAAACRTTRPVSIAAVMIAPSLAAGAFLWRWLAPWLEGRVP